MPIKKKAAKSAAKKVKKPAAKTKTAVKKMAAKKKPARRKAPARKKAPANVMGWAPGVPKEKPKGRVYDGPLRVNAKPIKTDRLFFGTGGVPHSAKPQSHPGAIKRLYELGLGVYEMEFVHGVRIRPETCEEVMAGQKETGIRVTAHGPYYINLYSLEEEKLEAKRSVFLAWWTAERVEELKRRFSVLLQLPTPKTAGEARSSELNPKRGSDSDRATSEKEDVMALA